MNSLIAIISIGFKSQYFKGLISKQPKSYIMKKLLFYLVGAMFLFVSCQSDDLQIDEALKSDNANVTKERTIEFNSANRGSRIILTIPF